MTARLFAENGIKPLMKGILRLLCRYQDQPRMMRLRGKWVECNPKTWDADMDVIVHVALGRGTDQDRLMALERHRPEAGARHRPVGRHRQSPGRRLELPQHAWPG